MSGNNEITVVGGACTGAGAACLPATSGSSVFQVLSILAIVLGVAVLITGYMRAKANK